jgi:hypothetical protein
MSMKREYKHNTKVHVMQLPVIKGYLMPKTGMLKSLELISRDAITKEITEFFKINKLYNEWQMEYIKMTFMLDEENEHVWYIGRSDFGQDRYIELNWMIGKEIHFRYQGVSKFK